MVKLGVVRGTCKRTLHFQILDLPLSSVCNAGPVTPMVSTSPCNNTPEHFPALTPGYSTQALLELIIMLTHFSFLLSFPGLEDAYGGPPISVVAVLVVLAVLVLVVLAVLVVLFIRCRRNKQEG